MKRPGHRQFTECCCNRDGLALQRVLAARIETSASTTLCHYPCCCKRCWLWRSPRALLPRRTSLMASTAGRWLGRSGAGRSRSRASKADSPMGCIRSCGVPMRSIQPPVDSLTSICSAAPRCQPLARRCSAAPPPQAEGWKPGWRCRQACATAPLRRRSSCAISWYLDLQAPGRSPTSSIPVRLDSASPASWPSCWHQSPDRCSRPLGALLLKQQENCQLDGPPSATTR